MLAQQAADTAVNTPITIAAGMADGKNRKEISKDIRKQMAVDALINMGFAGIGATGKALKNASRKGPIAGIDFEKIGYTHAMVNEGLMQFRDDILQGNPNKTAIYKLNEPNERMRTDVQRLTGVDVSDFKNRIKANAIDHIEKRHGVNVEHDRSMADPEDLAKLEYILNDYDDIVLSNSKKTGAYRNSDGSPAEKVMFSKRINGTYYVIEAVPDSKAKSLDIVSVYKSNPKNGRKTKKVAESFDVNNPQVTSKNVSQQPFNLSIEQNIESVKSKVRKLALEAYNRRK